MIKVKVPDIDYYREMVKCQFACPIDTRSGAYVQKIAGRKYEEAYMIARQPNPFPHVLGRICAHPCEGNCRRAEIDEPISIRALKRVACEHHQMSYGHDAGLDKAEKRRDRVAVIGAGPAGLSCAHDLARLGYQITVFEASPVAGGMLYLGIPQYRLPRDVIKMEVDAILNLGVQLRTNMAAGKDFNLDKLFEEGFKAVFIATGANKSRDLLLPGSDLDGVMHGIDFLINVNLGYRVEMGRRVVIVGGGNVAIDVARSASRILPENIQKAMSILETPIISRKLPRYGIVDGESMSTALDAARLALRIGAREVNMVCLEARHEMPAWEWEVEEAEDEGITLHCSRGPRRIVGKDNRVAALETVECLSVFNSEGRFDPKFREKSESLLECDNVILAIGQSADLSWIEEAGGIAVERGAIKVEHETLETTRRGIYAGGDIAFGPRIVVDAIADGQKAARSIHRQLRGIRKTIKKAAFVPVENHAMPENYDRIRRQRVPTTPLNRRVGISEVELCMPEEQALMESRRCLKCQIHTIFNSKKCILCGGCVDVCPENCLKMVKLDRLAGDERFENLKKAFLDRRAAAAVPSEGISTQATAMLKDEERCIRCGLCAKRCPTGAVTMEEFKWEEILAES